jgi:hypothetical protein
MPHLERRCVEGLVLRGSQQQCGGPAFLAANVHDEHLRLLLLTALDEVQLREPRPSRLGVGEEVGRDLVS